MTASACRLGGAADAHLPPLSFRPAARPVSAERILRLHGYRQPERIRPAVREAAGRCAQLIAELAEPQLCYRRLAVTRIDAGSLRLADGTSFRCAAFPRLLAGSAEVVLFVLTLGSRVDAQVIRWCEDYDLVDALLLETAGWLCIEACTKVFADGLRAEGRRDGFAVTARMGPGYAYRRDGGDIAWPLEDQRPLFGALGQPLPVRLLESCAMLPKLSRSGLFGLSRPERS